VSVRISGCELKATMDNLANTNPARDIAQAGDNMVNGQAEPQQHEPPVIKAPQTRQKPPMTGGRFMVFCAHPPKGEDRFTLVEVKYLISGAPDPRERLSQSQRMLERTFVMKMPNQEERKWVGQCFMRIESDVTYVDANELTKNVSSRFKKILERHGELMRSYYKLCNQYREAYYVGMSQPERKNKFEAVSLVS